MKKIDIISRNQIAELFSSAINTVIKEQSQRLSQEHQITSRMAQAVEIICHGAQMNNWKISARFQELPDKGPGSLEKKIGADLYIVIEIKGSDHIIRKGLYVQAKKAGNKKITSDELEQFQTLTDNGGANGGYIWIYDDVDVSVVPSQEVTDRNIKLSEFNAKNMNEHMRDVLDCFAGNIALCPSGIFRNDSTIDEKKLKLYLEEFSIPSGLIFSIESRE